MRVFFDATLLGSGTGIERFSRELLSALNGFDLDLTALVAHPQIQLPETVKKLPISRFPPDDTYRVLWQQTRQPQLLRRHHADVYFSPAPEGMFFPSVKQIISVLDVIPLRYPTNRQNTFFYRRLLPLLLNRCEAVLTISENTQSDIRALFPGYRKDIQVAYPGYTHSCFYPRPAEEQKAVQRKYGLEGRPFILFLGEARPYKNISGIMAAFAQADLPTCRLVVAGRLGEQEEPLRQKICELQIENQTALLGYVPDDDLAALYSSCQMFVFASLYEGFGIPPLEAMACGAPVILSDAASLPEVGGDAVMYVDPHRTDAICEAIRQVAHDPKLRHHLGQKGLARASHFSYHTAAEKLYQLMKKVGGSQS
ncbi:MAG: glycosyltransferase family 1 protein [Meiothermus sp.]|nr:glycosyltransferase family 1 protein [Meiothermus sp.]